MASAAGFSVNISAKDSASGTLDGINKRMAAFNKEVARSQKPMQDLVRNFQTMTGNTGLTQMEAGFQNVARHSLDAFRSVTRIVEPLAAITGAASVAGMYKLASSWATFTVALGNAAVRASLSARELHALENAGRLAGVSADAVASGMTALHDNMVKAQGGQAPQVIGMLQALGLSADTARRYALDSAAALPELADKIAALRDPTLQAQAATALFGGAGEQLLPFLRRGSAGVRDYVNEVQKYGLVNQASVDAANELRMAQARLSMAVEGLGYSVSERLSPYIGPLLTDMASWIARNREWISTGIGEKVGEFVTWLRGVDWAAVGKGIEGIFTSADHVAHALGGWQTAGEVLVAFFGVKWLAGMMAPILAVSTAIAKLPGMAASAATAANAVLTQGGLLGKLGAAGSVVGLGALGMEGIDLFGKATEPSGNGYANLFHNMLTEMNPLHWTQSYHPGQVQAAQGWFGAQTNRPAGAGPLPGPVQPMGPITHSAYNNNNPTNLAYYPGQRGVMGANGRWGVYGTAEAGIAAGLDQMLRDSEQKGFRTLADEIQHRSPPSENNTLGMIRDISAWSGIKPDEDLNLRDPDRARRFLAAVTRREQGRAPDPDMIRRGVATVLPEASGPERSLPANAGTASNPGAITPSVNVNGKVDVGVRVAAPPGTGVTAVQSGSGLAPLRIERSNVGFTGQGGSAGQG